MNNNFHKLDNPFERLAEISKLMNIIDNEESLSLVKINGFSYSTYTIYPKLFKYINKKLYIKVAIDNMKDWITFGEFITINSITYGIFEDKATSLFEANSYLGVS